MVLLHPDSGTDCRQNFCRDHSSDKSSELKTFKRVPLNLDFCTACIKFLNIGANFFLISYKIDNLSYLS